MHKVNIYTINNEAIEIITDYNSIRVVTRVEHAVDRKEMLVLEDINGKVYYISGDKILYIVVEELKD